MQTAAYLWPRIGAPGRRGWLAKLGQIRAARALEAAWTKEQILEAYLNLAPFRGETQGWPPPRKCCLARMRLALTRVR
jgi:penicillin-binding protein 1C